MKETPLNTKAIKSTKTNKQTNESEEVGYQGDKDEKQNDTDNKESEQKEDMENNQNTAFFESVFLDDYEKHTAEILEPKGLVNQQVPPQVTGTHASNVQVGTALLLGKQDTPPKLTITLHNQGLPRTRFRDHVVITKQKIHPKYQGLRYTYDFLCMDGVPNILGKMVSMGVYVRDTRALNPVEARNKEDEDKATKKNTKDASRTKKASTGTKNTNHSKKKSGDVPNSSTGGWGKSTGGNGNGSGGGEYGGYKSSGNEDEVEIVEEGLEDDRKGKEVEMQSFDRKHSRTKPALSRMRKSRHISIAFVQSLRRTRKMPWWTTGGWVMTFEEGNKT